MAYKGLLIVLIAVSTLYYVDALTCYQCDSASDGDECFHAGMDGSAINATLCEESGDYDICFKITTYSEQPNNGPQDRLSDNEMRMGISRGCGTKKVWERYTKPDAVCDGNTVAGGGRQERCVCSGNLCNSGSQVAAGLTLAATLVAAVMFA